MSTGSRCPTRPPSRRAPTRSRSGSCSARRTRSRAASSPTRARSSTIRGVARRYVEVTQQVARWDEGLGARSPNAWLAARLDTLRRLLPGAWVWLAAAVIGLAVRRPRHALVVALPAVLALVVLAVHALGGPPRSVLCASGAAGARRDGDHRALCAETEARRGARVGSGSVASDLERARAAASTVDAPANGREADLDDRLTRIRPATRWPRFDLRRAVALPRAARDPRLARPRGPLQADGRRRRSGRSSSRS